MRVTIDYDGKGILTKWKFTIGWTILNIVSHGKVYGRRSASGNFHLKCHGLKISFRTSLYLRLLLGDDKARIKFDLKRLQKPKQVLWSYKNGQKASEWTRNLLEVLQ